MTDDSTRTRTNVSNVLVIGSGAAGLRAAIAAHEAGLEAVVIGTRPRKDAHTVLAAGGINAALGTRDPEDSWQQHFADTLKEGYNLSDPRLAEIRDASNNVDVWPTPEGFNDLAYAFDLRGSLIVAEATILEVIERRETHDAHNRSDYPELDLSMKANFVVHKRDDGLAVTAEPVHTVPEYLEEWAKSDEEYGVVGRLVE